MEESDRLFATFRLLEVESASIEQDISNSIVHEAHIATGQVYQGSRAINRLLLIDYSPCLVGHWQATRLLLTRNRDTRDVYTWEPSTNKSMATWQFHEEEMYTGEDRPARRP